MRRVLDRFIIWDFAMECQSKRDYTGNNRVTKTLIRPLTDGLKRGQVAGAYRTRGRFSLSSLETDRHDGNNHQVERAFAISDTRNFNEPDGRENE